MPLWVERRLQSRAVYGTWSRQTGIGVLQVPTWFDAGGNVVEASSFRPGDHDCVPSDWPLRSAHEPLAGTRTGVLRRG